MEENNSQPKKKFPIASIIRIVIVIIVFVIGLLIGISIGGSNKVSTTAINYNTTASSKSPTMTITLSNGKYTAGKDFPAGTYTIEAISGHGKVSSSNIHNGGLNEVMASNGSGNSGAVSSYKNVELPNGTTLTVGNVTIKLISVN